MNEDKIKRMCAFEMYNYDKTTFKRRMKRFAEAALKREKFDDKDIAKVLDDIDKLNSAKEIAEYDCGIRLKGEKWFGKAFMYDLPKDFENKIFHLGKIFMLSDQSWMAVKWLV